MHVHLCVAKAFGGFICQPGTQLLQVELRLLHILMQRQLSCSSARMQQSAPLTSQSFGSCSGQTLFLHNALNLLCTALRGR